MSNKSKIRFKQQNLVLLVSNSVFKLAKLSSWEFSCRTKELLILHGSNFLLLGWNLREKTTAMFEFSTLKFVQVQNFMQPQSAPRPVVTFQINTLKLVKMQSLM